MRKFIIILLLSLFVISCKSSITAPTEDRDEETIIVRDNDGGRNP